MAEEKAAAPNATMPTNTYGKSIEDFDPPRKPTRNKFALACAALGCMTSILMGYDIGVMSGAIIYIRKDIEMTDVQKEVIMGILNLYSLVGSGLAGFTSDRIGRRYTIVLSGGIFFIGALLMGFARSYLILMLGRFVAGVGVGYGMMVAPVYTAEVSPTSYRGFLTSFPEIFANLGILLGYVSNYGFSKLPQHLGWRFMLGVGVIPAVVIALSVLLLPESPRWLVMQGRLGDAKRVLQKTSDNQKDASMRLADIKEAAGIPDDCDDEIVEVTKKSKSGSGAWRELFMPKTSSVRHVLLTGIGIHFFQQACGLDSVVLYSPDIFGKAGLTSANYKLLATIAVGLVKTSCILIATFNLDRFGRRPLLLTSVGGIFVSLCCLGTCLTIIEHSSKQIMPVIVICILSVLSSVGFFSMGLGPITWVYSSEIFPLQLRAMGCAVGVIVNRTTSGIISMTFLSLYKAVTIGGAYFIYAIFTAIAWIFFYTLMPETRGRTLEDMESLFGRYCKWRRSLKELEAKKKGANNNAGGANGNSGSAVQLPEK